MRVVKVASWIEWDAAMSKAMPFVCVWANHTIYFVWNVLFWLRTAFKGSRTVCCIEKGQKWKFFGAWTQLPWVRKAKINRFYWCSLHVLDHCITPLLVVQPLSSWPRRLTYARRPQSRPNICEAAPAYHFRWPWCPLKWMAPQWETLQ